MYRFYILTSIFLIGVLFCKAQIPENAPTLLGSTKGIVKDTAHNYVLRSATISIYKKAENTLLSYQITNTYGEFIFKNLPLGVPLKVEVSHVGYQVLHKDFIIPITTKFFDLKTLIVQPKDITLNEVSVTVPPITMNGDTLEFNAAAFKLDSNAVVEDLLRKIPNITLWGDGQITVNGREIKSLLVNGKPFFGGDTKIATQNIPKNALEKIQVYNTVQDETKPLDSTLQMNLKMKKGKDVGYFGKIGAGYGTDKRFEADVSLNIFSSKMELAIIGATNNINKTPNSIRSLMANSTFKGVGTSVDYQPDFSAVGLNQPNTTGLSFTYNFIEKPTYYDKNTITSNYFLQNKNFENLSLTETTTSVNSASKIFENTRNFTTSDNTNQKFDSKYELTKKNNSITISQALTESHGQTNGEIFRSAQNDQNITTSTNNTITQNNFNNSAFNFNARYRLSENYLSQKKNWIKNFTANYALTINDSRNQRLNLTEFKSYTNSASNRNFNRKSDLKTDGITQALDFEFSNLKSTLFGKAKLAGIDFSLTSRTTLTSKNENNMVEDLNVNNGKYERNDYLTNQIKTNILDETPGLSFNRTFSKRLSNRYSKYLNLGFAPKLKFIYQDNQSIRAFQNIKRNYSQFLPDASISANNRQDGEYQESLNLSYNTNINIPTIQQLAPLIDSTNLYSIRRGNLNLRAEVERVISISFMHSDERNKKPFTIDLQLSAGLTKDKIIDSTFIDTQNRRTIYTTNADGNKYLNLSGSFRKPYKLKTGEFQIALQSNFNVAKTPTYTNNLFAYSTNLNTNSDLTLNYTYKNYLAVVLSQALRTYRSKQEAFNTQYSGKTLTSSLSSSYNITKKFTLNTNISLTSNSSTNSNNVNFTIWNANAVYRFLKGNNAEFKFSALDLLHQNTSVINYGGTNSFTTGTQNVLQQYFMVTFAYYPRKFGKNAPKK